MVLPGPTMSHRIMPLPGDFLGQESLKSMRQEGELHPHEENPLWFQNQTWKLILLLLSTVNFNTTRMTFVETVATEMLITDGSVGTPVIFFTESDHLQCPTHPLLSTPAKVSSSS